MILTEPRLGTREKYNPRVENRVENNDKDHDEDHDGNRSRGRGAERADLLITLAAATVLGYAALVGEGVGGCAPAKTVNPNALVSQVNGKPEYKTEIVKGDTFYYGNLFVSREGGFSIPLKYSLDDLVSQEGIDNDSMLPVIEKNSSAGLWTYVSNSSAMRLESGDDRVGRDIFYKTFQSRKKGMKEVQVIRIVYQPITNPDLDQVFEENKKMFGLFMNLSRCPPDITIDGQRGKMYGALYADDSLKIQMNHIILYANGLMYSIVAGSSEGCRNPGMPLSIVRQMKFFQPRR